MITRQQIAAQIRRDDGLIDAHAHLGADPAAYYNGDYPYAISAEDHGVRMAQSGIAAVLCFPWVYTNFFHLAAYRRGVFRRDPRSESTAPYAFENQRLCQEIYEAFPEYAGRLLPFAFFDPLRRPREQAKAIRALANRYSVFGLKTATSYQQAPITALVGEGGCLLDLAAELDIPVTIHSAVLPGDPWGNVFAILKVVRARPDVRFAIAHTCRFDRHALDAAAALPNAFVDFSAFHIHCTLAQQNHPAVAAAPDRFPANYHDHATAMQQITEAYPGTMLWGSDTPAHLWKSRCRTDQGEEVWLDLPCNPTTEIEELRKLSPVLQRRIGHDNTCCYLFGNAEDASQKGTPHA